MVTKAQLRKKLESRDIKLVSGKTVPATGFSKQLNKKQIGELIKASVPRRKK